VEWLLDKPAVLLLDLADFDGFMTLLLGYLLLG
jgi:hypothetical protein